MAKTQLMMLGPPGAGKGTQAKRLEDELDIPQVSTGDMLRDARRRETELGQEAAEYMDDGELVPDDVVIGIVEERLQQSDADEGFILDGFPRTRKQAESLADMGVELEAVIKLQVSEDEIVRRLSGRLNCPECGAAYHEEFDPPEREGRCACGSELTRREDDRPEAVRERLETYTDETKPLVTFYRDRGMLLEINGEGSPDDVAARIQDAIGVST